MSETFERILAPQAPAPSVLIRLMVGAVFFLEGLQKFLYPAELGAGRFARIGIPWPELTGPFVGFVETTCGALLLVGLLTRLAPIPLIGVMLTAILSTKVPILLGYGFWGFGLRELNRYGFLSMAHEMRTDWSMLLGSIFLLVSGPDKFSLDALLYAKRTS